MMVEVILLTEEEAAERLGVSAAYLRQLLDSGRLVSALENGVRHISLTALQVFLDAEQLEAHTALDTMSVRARKLGLN